MQSAQASQILYSSVLLASTLKGLGWGLLGPTVVLIQPSKVLARTSRILSRVSG